MIKIDILAFWNGWWELEEGTIINVHNGKPLGEYHPWAEGKPNGRTLENCMIVWPLDGTWNDDRCNQVHGSFCNFDAYPNFNLRGITETSWPDEIFSQIIVSGKCIEPTFDTRYSWNAEIINGRYAFRGFESSLIFWDNSTSQWRLENMLNSPDDPDRVFAIANSTEYPFGNHEWQINRDLCENVKENMMKTT